MCGMFGRYAPDRNLGDLQHLCAATNDLKHRGPDSGAWWSEDYFFFGHRRLSIIDIANGLQPMSSHDRQYVIVFNGEIYNYLELKSELQSYGHTFITNSDTEVIIEGYRKWGADVCLKLQGMFAFAISDLTNGDLFVARDRFGEKPLFLFEENGGVTFSSELGAFFRLKDFHADIDLEALGGYLCLNYVPGNRTLAKGIRRLPPATWRRYSINGITEDRYWTPPEHPNINANLEEALGQLENLVDNAVSMALRSDVPVTIFLSGGIDSSLVAESAVRQSDIKDAYCLDFDVPTYSEFSNAKRVAQSLGLKIRRVTLTSDALEDFVSIVERLDDPLADSSALAVWTLAREVAKDYKVALSGDGGDELFGGYLTYQATAIHRSTMRFLPQPIRNALSGLAKMIPVSPTKVSTSYKASRFLRAANLNSAQAHFSWNGTWLPHDAKNFVFDDAAKKAAQDALKLLTSRHNLAPYPSLLDLQKADIADYLPNDILTKTDRMTMAFGLEARAPFLFPPLAEFALALPDHLKTPLFGKPKHALRKLAERKLGHHVSEAKKQGFSIPIHRWLRDEARHLAEDLLSPTRLKDLSFLNAAEVIKAKDLHMSGKAQLGFELWGLMTLVAWYHARILRKNPHPPLTDLQRVVF
ncbi:MAG: asparagine synthase (glutamine-hydrolyzing) [Rhodospirillales bacterium]|nr:asparagine synthase (glutamine-hydrolyzing) [Rhodospirillales bacterium]